MDGVFLVALLGWWLTLKRFYFFKEGSLPCISKVFNLSFSIMWWLLSTAIMLACCMQLPCWEVCFYSSWTEEDNPEMRSTWQSAPCTCAQPRGARWRWERVASLGACCPRESHSFTLSSCPLLGVRLCFISARDVLFLCRDRSCQYKMLCCTELLLSVYGINFLFQIGHIMLDSRDYWNPRAISDDLAVTDSETGLCQSQTQSSK